MDRYNCEMLRLDTSTYALIEDIVSIYPDEIRRYDTISVSMTRHPLGFLKKFLLLAWMKDIKAFESKKNMLF